MKFIFKVPRNCGFCTGDRNCRFVDFSIFGTVSFLKQLKFPGESTPCSVSLNMPICVVIEESQSRETCFWNDGTFPLLGLFRVRQDEMTGRKIQCNVLNALYSGTFAVKFK